MRALLILVAVIALPFAEIALVVWLVHHFGWGPVLISGALLFGFGIAMVRRASQKWSRLAREAQVDPGIMQTTLPGDMGDASLLFLGGLLLILPGYITGAVGLVFVFPPTRRLIGRSFGGRVSAMASQQGYRRVTIIEGETVAGPSGSRPDQRSPDTSPGTSQGPVIISGEIVAGPNDDRGRSGGSGAAGSGPGGDDAAP